MMISMARRFLVAVAVVVCAAPAGAVEVLSYRNASKELGSVEAFYDAHLLPSLPGVLGGLNVVSGDLADALPVDGCGQPGPIADRCPSLLEALVVPRWIADDYGARAVAIAVGRDANLAPSDVASRVARAVAPVLVRAGDTDGGCDAPAHSFYVVLRGNAAASATGWTAAVDGARNGLFVPGNAAQFSFAMRGGAAVRFCFVDASNFGAARARLEKNPKSDAGTKPWPQASGLAAAAVRRELDDPAFDTRMARIGRDLPWADFVAWPRPEAPPKRGKRNFGEWQGDQRWRWRVVGATIPEIAAPTVLGVSRATADLVVKSGYRKKAGDDAAFGFDVAFEAVGAAPAADGGAATHGDGAVEGSAFYDAVENAIPDGAAHYDAFGDDPRGSRPTRDTFDLSVPERTFRDFLLSSCRKLGERGRTDQDSRETSSRRARRGGVEDISGTRPTGVWLFAQATTRSA